VKAETVETPIIVTKRITKTQRKFLDRNGFIVVSINFRSVKKAKSLVGAEDEEEEEIVEEEGEEIEEAEDEGREDG
jgi:hypothetical protein